MDNLCQEYDIMIEIAKEKERTLQLSGLGNINYVNMIAKYLRETIESFMKDSTKQIATCQAYKKIRRDFI